MTVGTIFEDSHIPISKWLLALHLLASSKKGMSAHQLHRMLGISYKGAWFMAMRLRHAMSNGGPLQPLAGTVEADETYVGGRRKRGSRAPQPMDNKTPVVALDRYCDEFAFRHEHRKAADGVRAGLIVKGAEGKRLTYAQPA